MEKTMYKWSECWDGGIGSKYFESFEDCKQDAIKHVKGIRWTAKEMAEQARKRQDIVIIEKCVLDEDGEEISFDETGWAIEVNKDTVDRVY